MKGDKTVRLSGPAKIGGNWHGVGASVEVDAETEQQLLAAGVLETPSGQDEEPEAAPDPLIFTASEFEDAVKRAADRLASEAFDGALVTLAAEAKAQADAAEGLEAERDAAIARAVTAEQQRDQLAAHAQELQAALAALQPPTDQDNSPATTAKTAPKKGAAATKG